MTSERLGEIWHNYVRNTIVKADMSIHANIVERVAVRAVLTGKLPCNLYGTERQLVAFSEALLATREFDRLLSESEDVDAIMIALSAKRAAASKFKREFGSRWPA